MQRSWSTEGEARHQISARMVLFVCELQGIDAWAHFSIDHTLSAIWWMQPDPEHPGGIAQLSGLLESATPWLRR